MTTGLPASSSPASNNMLMLDTRIPFEDRLRRAAELWLSDGKRGDARLTGKSFELAYCWFLKHCDDEHFELFNRPDERRAVLADVPDVREFIEVSHASLGGRSGWDAILRQRVHCEFCGTSYRVENILLCTGCAEYLCYECDGGHRRSTGHETVG